jgi:AraC-like DNA-binding protein
MPLDNFCVAHTHDPEEMRHALVGVCGARSFQVLRRDGPFEGREHHCRLPNLALSYCRYNAPVELLWPESSWFRQHFCMTGSSETTFSRTVVAVSPERSCIVPLSSEVQMKFAEDYEQLVLRIDAEALTSKLAALLGARPVRPLEFHPSAELCLPEVQRLQRMAFFLVGEIDAVGPAPPPSLLAELEQAVMVCFLFGNRHNHTHLLERKAAGVAPRQVCLAEDYIEANWNRPITVEALAAATGVSVRSIFKYFRESRGYSPMAFVKQIRLERARAMLLAADATTSVTGVALACGFYSLGHFARDYRDCFGELPSETLMGKTR